MYRIEKIFMNGNFQKSTIIRFFVIDITTSKVIKQFNDYDNAEKFVRKVLSERYENNSGQN